MVNESPWLGPLSSRSVGGSVESDCIKKSGCECHRRKTWLGRDADSVGGKTPLGRDADSVRK